MMSLRFSFFLSCKVFSSFIVFLSWVSIMNSSDVSRNPSLHVEKRQETKRRSQQRKQAVSVWWHLFLSWSGITCFLSLSFLLSWLFSRSLSWRISLAIKIQPVQFLHKKNTAIIAKSSLSFLSLVQQEKRNWRPDGEVTPSSQSRRQAQQRSICETQGNGSDQGFFPSWSSFLPLHSHPSSPKAITSKLS